MSEIAIKDQVASLIKLQSLDADIFNFNREKIEKPRQIEVLKKEFEDKKNYLKSIEEKSKQLQVQLRSKETEVLSKDDAMQKSQTQLYQLKTNKEYQAKMLEIDGIKADKSVIEEEIIKIYDDIDAVKAEVEKEKSHLTEEEKVFNEQKKQVEARVSQIEQGLKALEANRQQIVPALDRVILSQYERILHNRGGLALVSVKDNSCQGCFMNVPHQVINEIKKKERLVVCEMCARILYIEGEF